MKRELTADKPTPIKSPKSPRGIENELGDFITYMVAQMAQRYRNQVLNQLQVGTVEKFADAQAGNYASVLLKLSSQVKRKLLKQFDDKRIEATTKQILAKLDKKSRQQFYERVAAKVGIDAKDLIAKEGMKAATNALMLETAQWIKTLRDESMEKFTNNSLFAMSQGESLDTIVSQFDGIVEKRKNHAKFLARNQVQNYNSITTKIRAQNLGIKKARWVTAGDERVRGNPSGLYPKAVPSHYDLDGKEFDLAEGAYADGEYLLPGVPPNCRCTYELIIPEEE